MPRPSSIPLPPPVALAVLVSALAPTLGCETHDLSSPPSTSLPLVGIVSAEDNRKLDILFVIDNSGSMTEEQVSLAVWAGESLFGALENEMAGAPDVHVGVVSTNVGAGQTGIQYCDGEGDDGLLQAAARVSGCSPPAGAYLTDDGAGTRNFEGEIGDAFACIAQLGITGCGFEQPLEAARRALDGRHAANDGFLRADALLAVIVVTDEDDCSASDRTLFDPEAAQLGPLDSFRCFAEGVACDPDDPVAEGVKTGCAPRAGSAYMPEPAEYAAFLRGLKPDPAMVMVAVVAGGAEPVEVGRNLRGDPTLLPACGAGDASAAALPSVRLQAFLDEFPARGRFASICGESMAEPLRLATGLIAGAATRSPCLGGAILDTDPASAGTQAECRVFEAAPGTAGRELPACVARPDARPCFTVAVDERCVDASETGLAVAVERAEPQPAGTDLLVRCRLAP